MKKFISIVSIVVALHTTVFAQDNSKELFIQKCAVCHVLKMPQDRSQMIAPPARGIMFHMSEAFSDNTAIKKHITDFTMNPTEEKAICNSINRFGLMPSQKDLVTPSELEVIADWMIVNLKMSEEEHNKQQGK